MDHLSVFEKSDGFEGCVEIDFLQKQEPVLTPPVEKMGDVLLKRLETGLAEALSIENRGTDLEHELHPPGGIDETLEQALARRRDRLSKLADVLVPDDWIVLGRASQA
jgi:hypothetical protein